MKPVEDQVSDQMIADLVNKLQRELPPRSKAQITFQSLDRSDYNIVMDWLPEKGRARFRALQEHKESFFVAAEWSRTGLKAKMDPRFPSSVCPYSVLVWNQ